MLNENVIESYERFVSLMKKFSCLILCMCLILSGCGTTAVEDVGVVEPETYVVTEELDASVYTGKSFAIDPKSCYIDVSYDGFNMVVGSKDSVAYMKTSVEDLSSAFWFDYNTETIYFEDNTSGEVVLSKGSVTSDSVEDTTGTEFGSFVITNAIHATLEGDYINITGDIDMEGTVYNDACVVLYTDNTLRSLSVKDEESEINIYSLTVDSSMLPNIPEGDFKEITTEEAEESLFATVMLLMTGAMNSVETSVPEEIVTRTMFIEAKDDISILDNMVSELEDLNYVTSAGYMGNTVMANIVTDDYDTVLAEIKSMFGNATWENTFTFNIVVKTEEDKSDFDANYTLANYCGYTGTDSYISVDFAYNGDVVFDTVLNTTKAELAALGYELYYDSDLSDYNTDLKELVDDISDSAYSMYDDVDCSGIDVLTALKSYRDSDLAIVISNDGVKAFNYCGILPGEADFNLEYVYMGDGFSDTKNEESESYVPTNSVYVSELIYSDNDVVGILFTNRNAEEVNDVTKDNSEEVEYFGTY